MQLINSTVIREHSTIIFFQELIYGNLYLGGLYPGAYNRVLISGWHISRGLISGGFIPGNLFPGAYIRGTL